MAGLPDDLLLDTPPGWEEMVASLDTSAVPEPAVAPMAPIEAPVVEPQVAPVPVDNAVPVEQPLPDFGLDAVSGGDPSAQDPHGWQEFIQGGDQPVDPTVEAFSLERPFEGEFQTEEDPSEPPPWADPNEADGAEVQIRELGFEGMSPDERAAEFARDAELRRQEAARRQSEELRKAADAEQDAFDSFQTATTKHIQDREMLRVRLDELSKRDPDTFFSGPMTGRKAFGWVRAILTGLVSPLHGLAALKASMDDDLQLQEQSIKREMIGLEKSDNMLGEELALQGDLYKAKRNVQIAWLQKLPAMLEAEAAKYDPNGSLAITGFNAAQKARADAQAAMAAWEQDNFKNNLDLAKARREEERHLAEMAKLGLETAKLQGDLRGGGGGSEKPKPGDSSRMYPVFDATTGQLTPRTLTEEERGKMIVVPGTGEAFIAGTREERNDMNKRIAAARNISNALSEMNRLRDENGWEVDTRWYSSKEAQRAVSAYQRALINYKEAYGLGAISESDLKLIEGAIGGKPTGFKDFMGTVESTRLGIEDDIRNTLIQAGWTGNPADIKLPAYASKGKAKAPEVADLPLRLDAAIEKAKAGDVSKLVAPDGELAGIQKVLDDVHQQDMTREKAREMAAKLRSLPKEQQEIPRVEEAIQFLDKFGNEEERKGSKKEAKEFEAEEKAKAEAERKKNEKKAIGPSIGGGKAQ